MQKHSRKKIIVFKSLTILVASAFLAALSIVFGKYLAIPIGTVMRFSFENTPIILAGIIFGAPVGAMVGAVADLVGCVLVGYEINIAVTLGAVLIGFVSGLCHYILKKLGAKSTIAIIIIGTYKPHMMKAMKTSVRKPSSDWC